ncbi:MAG: glutamate racemase [Stappia sp.]|uniref:glutamate racemase n=1 Tax=Stappia sp. TaxID=1870903 RepID=UPI000C656808|nr:glutamate racemase [Stappia sp.]MAB00357.1 glutamate racemase [Stappia sp.]MBM19772.1 glutamate racemase [Stappia sp.]
MSETRTPAGRALHAGDAPVLVFDSGVGGVSVARAIRAALPGLPILYYADLAAFPYGDWDPAALTHHCVGLVRELVATHCPRALVIACNTASTLILPPLRAVLDIPVVGTVPAIKPAAQLTRSGVVAVLATPGTVRREYTFDLIERFASEVAVTLVGSRGLARLAEERLRGGVVSREALLAEIRPCFVEKAGRRTDVVVLACTHYPLLLPELREVAPWPVTWIDPAPAIARRLADVLDLVPGGSQAEISGPAAPERDRILCSNDTDLSHLLALIGESPETCDAGLARHV